jgi:hypothetical protein
VRGDGGQRDELPYHYDVEVVGLLASSEHRYGGRDRADQRLRQPRRLRRSVRDRLAEDLTGSFRTGLWVVAGLMIVAGLAALRFRRGAAA